MIKHIKASNILSFGPDGLDLELKPLNVLIGANGTGKSNLIELIDLVRSTPYDVSNIFRKLGGFAEWRWKGAKQLESFQISITCETFFKDLLRHNLDIYPERDHFNFYRESIEVLELDKESNYPLYQNTGNFAQIKLNGSQKLLSNLSKDASILYHLRDPENYPELTYLSEFYSKIYQYREWTFGRNTIFRKPQPADLRTDRLESDFSNIGLFLNRLRRDPKTKRELVKHLQYLYEGITDFEINIIEGGFVQILFTEGDFSIPASRLSDGTLRYLCLLAILLDPNPPALICIEEPELGLHPDILPHLTDLLVEASERTQLIITTHSDVIVDALTEYPESILVCEKHNGQTSIRRLESEKIKPWLEDYRLGALWSKGEIGGNRW